MATKDAFERAWFAQFSSGAVGASPPLPSLACWDSSGALRSTEALRDELDKCRLRIVELRRKLRAEEFVEFYCQQELNSHRGAAATAGSNAAARPIAKRSASAPFSTKPAPALPPPVPLESIYSEPVDSRPPHSRDADRPFTPEGIYAEPVDSKARIPSDSEPLYAIPAKSQPTTEPPAPRRVQRRVYEEIVDVRAGAADAGGDNSSDDESVANLVAIRQSVSRLSQWCVDGDAARRKLEMQAQRLSSRFSCAFANVGSFPTRNNGLDSVPESLLSPTTPSGWLF